MCSDINDRYEDGDPDVIQPASPPVDIAAAAVNIMRVVDDDRGDGVGGSPIVQSSAATAQNNGPAPLSSGSQALALMVMFDLDREAER